MGGAELLPERGGVGDNIGLVGVELGANIVAMLGLGCSGLLAAGYGLDAWNQEHEHDTEYGECA